MTELKINQNGLPISAEGLKAAEAAANRIIWENVPVNITYPTREELAALTYRSKKEIEGRQRRIFCAPDFNLADQRISAIDCILFHIYSYFCCTGSLSIASISSFSA